VIAGAKIYIFL